MPSDYSPSDDRGFLLELLAMPLRWGRKRLRSFRAATWPVTEAVIETGEVLWGRGSLSGPVAEYATAKLGYSYLVKGQYYSGYHTEWFKFAQDAFDYVTAWKGGKVRVRYHPRKPELSVWREQDQWAPPPQEVPTQLSS